MPPKRKQNSHHHGVTPTDEALSKLSEEMMKFTTEHHGSGYIKVDLNDPESSGFKFFQAIDSLITTQRKAGHVNKQPQDIESCIEPFLNWLTQNGMDMDSVPLEIRTDLKEGGGLVATKDILVKDKFLVVPHKLIMSTITATKGGIDQIKADPIKVGTIFKT